MGWYCLNGKADMRKQHARLSWLLVGWAIALDAAEDAQKGAELF